MLALSSRLFFLSCRSDRYAACVESFSAMLTCDWSDEDGGWTVVVPEVGQATVADPGLADFEVRQLLQRHLNLDWFAVEDLDIRLVDGSGAPLYVFNLPTTSASRRCGSGPAAATCVSR